MNEVDGMDFYTIVEFAEYVDMHPNSLEKHIAAGRLRHDYHISGVRVFRQNTVDEFVEKWLECEGWTLKEIATMYGVNRDAVYWHVRTGKLRPIGWFRSVEVYDREDVTQLAKSINWKIKRG